MRGKGLYCRLVSAAGKEKGCCHYSYANHELSKEGRKQARKEGRNKSFDRDRYCVDLDCKDG
jgi:hypothetical protein